MQINSNVYLSDWINSHPVFYNTKTLKASNNINDVVEWGSFEFDNEGLANYLKFGYLVFEKTVFKDVFRLPPCSELKISELNGVRKLSITTKDDEVLAYLEGTSTADDCINKIKLHVEKFERDNQSKRILLPLSGGHDSRLLLSMLQDKSKIDAITYDISMSQRFSSESIHAQFLSQKFNLNWKNVTLENYFKSQYCSRNFNMFGVEMPIHASYHMEMYDIAQKCFDLSNSVIVSGSVGDWWSGEKVPLPTPRTWIEAERLFFNHGLCIPEDFLEIKYDRSYNESVIQPNFDLISESSIYRTIFSRRGRVGLSGFIARVAESYAPTYTPFYDIDIATSQLKLSKLERADRLWQKEYFAKKGLDFGLTSEPLVSFSKDCSQDLQAAWNANRNNSLKRINPKNFSGIIKPEFINWLNTQLERLNILPIDTLQVLANNIYSMDNSGTTKGSAGATFDKTYQDLIDIRSINTAIASWTVLLPLQLAMEIRDGT